MTPIRVGLLCLALGAGGASIAMAQQTRAEAIAEAQAEKSRRMAPYTPNKAERIATDIKNRLFDTPEGSYPWFDSVYSGGGFTMGAGYRRFIGDHTTGDVRGLLSAKSYKLIEAVASSFGHPRPFEFRAAAGWRDATQVAFYGVGSDTIPEAKSNFRLQQGYAGISGRLGGPSTLFGEAGLRYENYTMLPGDGSSPSIEAAYTADTVPGLGASPDFVRATLTGGVDWRSPSAGYARRGGLYAVTFDAATNLGDGTYSHEVVQAEAVQHVPLLRENWVVSLHGVVRTTMNDADVVPYFLLPSLGSGSTLRAYPSWRFRDRHSLLMSAEWRWLPTRLFLDVALFYDAGKVARQRADLDFNGLTHNWGIGVRFHSPLATPLRIELARGREGTNLVFSGAAAF